MTIKLNKEKISIICFFIICFIVTRQIPFGQISLLSNLALCVLFFIKWPKERNFSIFTSVLLCAVGYSLINENDIVYIVRFFIILLSICAAYYLKLSTSIIKPLVYLCLIQCIFIIAFEIYLVFISTPEANILIRIFFKEMSWGDVYTLNDIYYKIQIKGNAILPFVYMLSFCYPIFPQKYDKPFKAIFLISILLSGQFAFLIAITAFHIYFMFRRTSNNRRLLYKIYSFILILSLASVPIYHYVENTMKMKSEESSAIRIEQTRLLLEDMNESPLTLIMGKGIGNTLSVQTSFRDYTDNIYFELQTIYILNQSGIILFILFMLYNIYLSISKIRYKELLSVYLFYTVYAVTNPYIFDTNHFIVIITLCSISNYLTNKKHNSSLPCK